MLYQGLKTPLEQLHVDYLTATFSQLQRGNTQKNLHYGLFDLIAEDCIFELKSRIYTHNQAGNRSRPKSDHCWWMLDETQRITYQQWCERECHIPLWIFLIADTEQPIQISTLCEDSILHRDL